MSKNLGVLKKETVCNSGGNSMDTRICVLKWRGSTYGSDRSVPDVSDADLYDRTADSPVTQRSKWSISVAVLILHVEILHTPSVSDLCKKRECLLGGDTLFSAFTGFLSQYLKYRKKWVKSQCFSLLFISVCLFLAFYKCILEGVYSALNTMAGTGLFRFIFFIMKFHVLILNVLIWTVFSYKTTG